MTIELIKSRIKSIPTFMELQDEMLLIEQLTQVATKDLIADQEFLWDLLERIDTSHTQSIFQVNASNIDFYKNFSEWIRRLKLNLPEDAQRLEIMAINMESCFRMA